MHLREAEAHYHKGVAHSDAGELESALAAFRDATLANPCLSQAWSGLAMMLAKLGSPEESVACYTRALDIDPGNVEILLLKGNTLGQLHRHDEELVCYKEVLRLEPQNLDALFRVGLSLGMAGRAVEAGEVLREAQRRGHPKAEELIRFLAG